MHTNEVRHDDTHAKPWELLPWLANGTLDEWSRGLVEEHARDCVTCRKELELLRGVGEAVRSGADGPLAPQRSLSALMSRIDSEEAARAASPLARLRDLVDGLRLSLRGVVAVQAVVLLLVAGTVAWLWWQGREPRFQTLSSSPQPVATELARVRVVFDDSLAVAEMREILAEIGARVVEGPSPHGVYTVALEPGADLSSALERLRGHEGVRFAEPHGSAPAGPRP